MKESSLSLRERRRRELVHAVEQVALDQIIEKGFDAVSVSEICDGVGISQSTFFRHFPTKDAVIRGFTRSTVEETAETMSVLADDIVFVDVYFAAFRDQVTLTAWGTDENLHRYSRVMASGPFRAAFIDDIVDGASPGMDHEIERRLGLAQGDPLVRTVRMLQWNAVDSAISALQPEDGVQRFLTLVEENLAVLGLIEREWRGLSAQS